MKRFFKRSFISMVALGISTTYAMPTYMPSNYFIGLEALDLRPMNGDLDVYRTVFTPPSPSTADIRTHAFSTDFNWAWRLFAGFRIGDNDLTLSWLRWRAGESLDANFDTGAASAVRYLSIGEFTPDFSSVDAHVDFDLDEVYGVWGYNINFNNPWSMRFAGGIEYARLDSDLSVAGFTGSASTFGNAESTSHFQGWGPRGEFDLTYHFPRNFMIFANTNAALLVSKRTVDFNDRVLVNIGDDVILTFLDDVSYVNRRVVVPKFGMRLGIGYTFPCGQIGGEGSGSMTLTAGWQVESYIHAIERLAYDFSDELRVDATKVSNFGDHGLFLGITYNS